MNINFDEMSDNSRELYKYMWGKKDNIPGDPENLCRTYDKRYVTESKNSYSFFTGIENKEIVSKNKRINEDHKRIVHEHLSKIFNIENKETFCKKFSEVCSGSGSEVAKITTLHSSSLCGLLFFYNVKQKNVTLTLNGKEITFDDVYFEFKNKVTEKGNPSNIDVVLLSSKQEVVLFLESKFSEYLIPGAEKIRYTYKNEFGDEIYNEDFLELIGMQFISAKGEQNNLQKDYFSISSSSERPAVYATGIKQFISHFIGVRNYIKGGPYKSEKRSFPKKYKVYLGEIVFDDFKFTRGQTQFSNYRNHYKMLVNGLKTLNPKFELLEDLLKYSDLKDYCESTVRKFYFRNE